MIDARQIGTPQPGFFKMRLVRKGPWVSARISYAPPRDPDTGELLDRSYAWTAEAAGELLGEPGPDPIAAGVYRIWERGHPITPDEWRFLERCRKTPGQPESRPRQVNDPSKQHPIF